MHLGLRFILLLILSIALRGFGGIAYALPSVPEAPPAMADCFKHAQIERSVAHNHHEGDEKSCQISCEHAVSPALAVEIPNLGQSQPSVLTPSLPVLAINGPPAPDHPPPIR